MSQEDKRFTKGQVSAKGERSGARKERLAEALRENLKKRKRQARARKQENQGGESEPDKG